MSVRTVNLLGWKVNTMAGMPSRVSVHPTCVTHTYPAPVPGRAVTVICIYYR